MNIDIILGILRHVLTGAGSVLVAKGYTDAAGLEQAIGAILTIVGIIWSAAHKKGVEKKIENASAPFPDNH